MSARVEPSVSFYRGVYAVGTLALVTACALGISWALRSGLWAAAALPLAVLALLLLAVRRRAAELHAYAHIPGPRPSFFVGNLPALMDRGHGGRDQALAALHAEYGPVVRIHLAWGHDAYVSLAYASANLHRKDLDSQRRADRTLLPTSLMGMPRGEQHRAHRLAMAPFFTVNAVKAGGHVLREVSGDYVDRWRANGGVGKGALQQDIHRWSAHCMSSYMFGAAWDTTTDLQRYFAALAEIEEQISFRAFHPFFVRWIFPLRSLAARAAYLYLYGFLGQVFARRAAPGCPHRRGGPADLLGEFVKLHANAGSPWSRRECVEEMMSLVLGGTDAMSYAIDQTLILLSRSPEVQAEARRRVAAARSAGEAAHEVPYVKHILYESFRLYPPVPFSAKVAHEGLVEEGLAVPPGATIMWAKNVVGRNAAIFPEPERFDPERFEQGHETAAAMLPFGAGPRHCIGNRLAEAQCVALLTEILENFNIEAIEGLDVTFRATVSISLSVLPVRLTPL